MKLVNVQTIKNELERLIHNYRFYWNTETKYRYEAYKELSEWLDGLEVKEVGEPSNDLEEEIDKELHENWYGEYINLDKFRESAKHFYELGMQQSKK
jgi:hypothetical protein